MKHPWSPKSSTNQNRRGRRIAPQETAEGQSLPQRATPTGISTQNNAPIRIENPHSGDHAPIPPAQVVAGYEAIDAAVKNARKNPVIAQKPGRIAASMGTQEQAFANISGNPEYAQEDDAPMPPALLESGLVGSGIKSIEGIPQVTSSQNHHPSTTSPHGGEYNTRPGALRVGPISGQVGINVPPSILPTQDTGDEASEPGLPIFNATLVEDEERPVYDAVVAVQRGALEHHENNNSGSPSLETNAVKTERCLWKYVLVLVLLAILGVS